VRPTWSNRASISFSERSLLARTILEIVGYGTREEKGRLGDHPDPPSQLARGNVAVILSIQIHRSRSRLVQSIEEAKKGGLAGAARPDNRQNVASFNLNADVVNQTLTRDHAAQVLRFENPRQP